MAGRLKHVETQIGVWNAATAGSDRRLDFQNVFTSDYDVYKIVTNGLDHGQGNRQVTNLRVMNSSGVVSTSNYDLAGLNLKSNGSSVEQKTVGGTSWSPILGDGFGQGSGSVMYIFNPTDTSSYTFMVNQYAMYYDIAGPLNGGKQVGVYKVTDEITGISYFDNGTLFFSGGTISIYGVQ
jgi:hypothetical protein